MLLDVISSAPQYRTLLAAMAKRGWPAQMTGLGHIHKAAVAAALSETGPFLVITPGYGRTFQARHKDEASSFGTA